MNASIPQETYCARREAVLEAIGGGVAVLPAGDDNASLQHAWSPNWNFYYLCGVEDEPGAILLLDGGKRETVLYLRPLNPEVEQWDGLRHPIGGRLRQETGLDKIFRTGAFAGQLAAAARRTKRLVCLLPFTGHERPLSADLEIFRKVQNHVPGASIEDMTDLLPRMRCKKDEHELALTRKAIEITLASIREAAPHIKPGTSEFDIQEQLEHGYRTRGARRTAFSTIIGGGLNSTVLHYRANDQPLHAGELVVVDTGAMYESYSADITRTFPVSGTFTEEQAKIYDLVLDVQMKIIEMIKPGVTLDELNRKSKDLIETTGYGDYYPHGIGHFLGGEVHDVGDRDAPLEPGVVITVEPGIYIPENKLGVRIEDDVVVTETGCEVLSANLPKTRKDIEAMMRG